MAATPKWLMKYCCNTLQIKALPTSHSQCQHQKQSPRQQRGKKRVSWVLHYDCCWMKGGLLSQRSHPWAGHRLDRAKSSSLKGGAPEGTCHTWGGIYIYIYIFTKKQNRQEQLKHQVPPRLCNILILITCYDIKRHILMFHLKIKATSDLGTGLIEEIK